MSDLSEVELLYVQGLEREIDYLNSEVDTLSSALNDLWYENTFRATIAGWHTDEIGELSLKNRELREALKNILSVNITSRVCDGVSETNWMQTAIHQLRIAEEALR